MENKVDKHFHDNSSYYTIGCQDQTWSDQIDTLNRVLKNEDKSIDAIGDVEKKRKAIEEIKTQIKLCIQMSKTDAKATAPAVLIPVIFQPEEKTEHRESVPDASFFTNSQLSTVEEKEKISKQVRKHRNLNENRSKSKLNKRKSKK
jgi:hypothetical protein